MGLFDFAKNMGKKVFDDDKDAAAKIKETLESDNPGVESLDVAFADGKVGLKGKAETSDALEKAVLIAGNVQGVETVDVTGVEAPASQTDVVYYIIESGDTLGKIAQKYLGDAKAYPMIFEANKEVIKDPDLIYPGQKIRIPGGVGRSA